MSSKANMKSCTPLHGVFNWERAIFLTLVATALFVAFAMPEAFADDRAGTRSNDTAMGNVLCSVAAMVFGNMGRGLATLAILILGVGATLGKVSWGLAMLVGVGIAVVFNANTIIGTLGANAAGCWLVFS